MNEIKRNRIDEDWADSAIVEAGDFVYIGYCMRNEGESIEKQILGAIEVLEERLASVGLGLDCVVQIDCLFRKISDLYYLPKIIKTKYGTNYPARKAYETTFIRDGISFQIDAVAYRAKGE